MNRGIFARESRAWLFVLLYTLFLYGSLQLAYLIYVAFHAWAGGSGASFWMNMMFVGVGTALAFLVLKRLPKRRYAWPSFLLLCAIVALSLEWLTVPAKRFHFFQYAPLTVLVLDALRFRIPFPWLYPATLLFVTLIGIGDEGIQALLPQRHFGWLDVGINATAGFCTLFFIEAVMGRENYPWPDRKTSH